MTEATSTIHPNIWFEGSVSEAVNSANTNNSVLLVCLIQNSENEIESSLFERRFTDEKIAAELSSLNLIALRLIKDSTDGIMFGQIFPVMVVPSLYIIRNGLLADFMNSSVDMDQMMERIKNAVNGQSMIPPPPSFPGNNSNTSSSQVHTESGSIATTSIPTIISPNVSAPSIAETSLPSSSTITQSSAPSDSTNTPNDRSQELKTLMQERKAKREKEEREAEKQKEKDRRASSKTLSDVQRELAEKQSKKLKDQIEKEKRDEAEYKKKLRLELENDKARRKAEREAAKAARTAEELSSSLSQARNDAAPALAFDTSRLNVRLFDGSSIRNTFQATDTLETVREWIGQNMEDTEVAYNIVQLIPQRTFTDESKMLRDLELCPSATLVLKKISSASSAYGAANSGAVPALLGYGWSALGKLAASAYNTASYYNPLSGGDSSEGSSSSQRTSNNRQSGPASSKKKDSEISYNGNSTNLE